MACWDKHVAQMGGKKTEMDQEQMEFCFSGAEHLGCYTGQLVTSVTANLAHKVILSKSKALLQILQALYQHV